MPGFMDTHVHLRPPSPRDIDMKGVKSIEDLKARVRAKAEQLGPGEWVTGTAWDEALLAEKRNPTKVDLDAAAPNNPVALVRAGGHSIVGNTLAIKAAKITRDTPDPHGALIEKGPDGEPNGIIRENNSLYGDQIPDDTWDVLRAGFVQRLKDQLPLGITSVYEASGTVDDEPVGKGGTEKPGPGLTWKRAQDVYREHGAYLPRMAMYISYPGAERLKAFPYKTGHGDDRVRIGAIGETAVDGGFTGPTAWTLADYKGQPGFRGKGRFTDAELQEIVDTCGSLGWQMGLHAIGDAAIVQTVNAYSNTLRKMPTAAKSGDHRWFLDHFTIMPPDATMQTMAQDKIAIAQQPNFLYNLEGRYEATLDPWRLAHNNSVATPAKKFGIFTAFGSDNLPIGPMVGLYAAVTRKGPSGRVHGAEEAVTIQEAIRMYTANGPYLTWEEKTKGTLEVGKLADMIVLDTDPIASDPAALLTTNVDMTIVGGKVVYERKA
jgi:predicted amidohydrolase YtcJ